MTIHTLIRRVIGKPVDDEVDQPYDPEPELDDVEPDTYDTPDIGDEASVGEAG